MDPDPITFCDPVPPLHLAARLGEILDFHNFVLSRYFSAEPVEFERVLEDLVAQGLHGLGEIDPRHDAIDALMAGFPAGTVSGAPKVRAMEIIAELEPARRGVYCGSVGYISLTGAMDTSIVIRTYVAVGGQIYFQAGGGIVADSDPELEYLETLDKAKALIEAL